MTEFDRLKAALKAAPPAPDEGAKSRALRLAQDNFARHQETADRTRPIPDRPQSAPGPLEGLKAMFGQLRLRPLLYATSSIVVIGVGVLLVGTDRAGLGPNAPTTITPVPPVAQPGSQTITEDGRVPAEADADRRERPAQETNESDDLADGSVVAAAPAPAPARPATKAEEQPRSKSATAETMGDAAPSTAISNGAIFGGTARSPGGNLALDELAPPIVGIVSGTLVRPQSQEIAPRPEPDTEAYADAAQNTLKITAEEPVSTFSIDVDTASYALIRSSLMAGYLPPPEAVRIEEMVNYFPYAYPAPEGQHPFATEVSVIQTPWNPGTRLVHIGIQGEMPATEVRPPLDLVFLIDTSGSMQDPNKLPLLKQSLRLMLGELRTEDRVAIVTYAGSAGQVLAPTPASDRATILAALERLEAGGSTAGQEGLQQAYSVAEGMAREGEGEDRIGRVILATDGDFNVGISDPAALKALIAAKRESGTYLSVLGFGRGNLDDATMQALAQNGNGQAAYIDTLNEARKVLVDQLTGALFPIANDVKIQVEFNPAAVAEYRLIGYETRALAREDFNNDRVDAGEIGAGHRVTAIYEVTPVGSSALRSDPLRYGTVAASVDPAELGFLKLRYKQPGEAVSILIERPIGTAVTEAGIEVRFAAAIAGFGQLLTDDRYLDSWGYAEAIALATEARGVDAFGYRAEAVNLMRLAESLSESR